MIRRKKAFIAWFSSVAAVFVLSLVLFLSLEHPAKQQIAYGDHGSYPAKSLSEYSFDSDTQLMTDVADFSLDLDYSSNYDTLCFYETVLNQLNDDVEYLCCAY